MRFCLQKVARQFCFTCDHVILQGPERKHIGSSPWLPGVLGYFMGLGYWVLGSWGSGLRLSFVSQQKNKSSQRKREINAHDSLLNNVVVFCLFFKLYTATHLIQKQWFSDCAKKMIKKNKSHKWKNKLCTEVTCQCFANMTIIYFWELCDRN